MSQTSSSFSKNKNLSEGVDQAGAASPKRPFTKLGARKQTLHDDKSLTNDRKPAATNPFIGVILLLLVLVVIQAYILYVASGHQITGQPPGTATSPLAQVIAITLGMTVAAFFTAIRSSSSK